MPKKDEVSDLIEEANKIINKDGKITYSLEEDENPTIVKTFISTGSTLLDYAIANKRNGGVGVGKLTLIEGLESTGKTLVVSHIAANAQKMGAVVFYADTESAISPEFMRRLGVDLKKRISYFQPPTIEKFFSKAEEIIIFSREKISKDIPVVIILDSLAATPINDEVEGTYNPKELMGVRAKAISLALRKLTQVIGYEKITLILINQLRMKMNVANPYQDPYVSPGGMGAPFHASTRIRLKSKLKIKAKNNDIIGVQCNAKVLKNRLGPPFREANFSIMFDYGIDNLQSIYEYLKDKDQIKKDKVGMSYFGKDEFKTSEWRNYYGNNKQVIDDLLENLLTVRYNESDVNSDSIESVQDSEMDS